VGVFRTIVIFPSRLDFPVVHHCYARLAPDETTGAMTFVKADCAWMRAWQE